MQINGIIFEIAMKIVEKAWGSEQWIANNSKYCGKILNLKQGFRCSKHLHKEKDETFYLLEGKVALELGNKTILLKPGDSAHVLQNTLHSFAGLEDSRIIEFSTTHSDADSYRKTKSGAIPLNQIFAEMKQKKILVVGDVMLDEFVIGNVERMSPEAPVPVINVKEIKHTLGGAANTANNISALGARAVVAGIIGNDAEGKLLRKLIANAKIDSSCLFAAKRKTTKKSRLLAGAQQIARIDSEATEKISRPEEAKLIKSIKNKFKGIDAVIVCDYNKGVITKNVADFLSGICKKNGKPLLVDSKNFMSLKVRGAFLLKPNEKELANETAMKTGSEKSFENAARKFYSALKPEFLVVTRGAKGISVFDGKKFSSMGTRAEKIVDITGAGDTVIAALALGAACGLEVFAAVELANYAAGIVIKKPGTSVASPEKLNNFFMEGNCR